jgi:hypothetical protein
MYKINDFLNFLKNKHFKSILMYNCENVSHNDLINLLNYTDEIYFNCQGNFVRSSLAIKLRSYRNIHFSGTNYITNIFYDVIFSQSFDKISPFIINNNEIKYFIYLNKDELTIPGFDNIGNNIYVRNKNKILIDTNIQNNEFISTNGLIPEIDKKIEELKANQVDLTKNKNYFELNVKNIVPIEIKYDKKEKVFFNDGIPAIKFVINSSDDFKYYNDNIENVLTNYSYVKIFLVLNGKDTFKIASNIKNVNNLIKVENPLLIHQIDELFNNIINHEHVYDLRDSNLSKLWTFNDED